MFELHQDHLPSTVSKRTWQDGAEQFDFLDRLAQLSDRICPYSAASVAIASVALVAGTVLRLVGWGQSDLMFVACSRVYDLLCALLSDRTSTIK